MDKNSKLYLKTLLERQKDLLISISGVRGTIPAGLDPENVTHFALAFASITGKTIVIGKDSRPTGDALKSIFTGTLIACGKNVIDIGLAPTPTIKAAVNYFGAHAGVIVSASHNPLDWNGFKFLGKNGFFFSQEEGEKLLDAFLNANHSTQNYKKFGSLQKDNAIDLHIKSVLKVIPNIKQIQKKKYKVVVDAVDGAGREALPLLLKELGCTVIELYCKESKKFPRPPEPTPSALKEFGRLVQSKKASVGFAMDPDADRLVCASPKRGCINEEYTLPLSLLGLRRLKKNAAVVLNLSTSQLTDHVAEGLGLRVFRSAVGEANVVAMMKKKKSVFGGEGNGGVILPDVPSFGRDTLTGAALILSAMATKDLENLDGLMDDLPNLFMKKTKFALPKNTKPESLYGKIQKIFPQAKVDVQDGLHLQFEEKSTWLHIRPSNTEPVVRLIVEAKDNTLLKSILAKVEDVFV